MTPPGTPKGARARFHHIRRRIRMPRWSERRTRVETPRPFAEGSLKLARGSELGFGRYGAHGGRPVFWFHGTPGGRHQLPLDAPSAAELRGLEIISVERPGIGESTHQPERCFLSYAQDIAELADSLGHREFSVVGLSGGGPYVLACAHELPERVVVGVSLGGVGPCHETSGAPSYGPRLLGLMKGVDRHRAPLGALLSVVVQPLRPLVSPCFDLYVKYGPQEDRPVFERPEMKAMFCRDIVAATERGIRAPIWDLSLFSRPWPFDPANIRVPIHFYHGDADTIVPMSHSEYLAEVIPDTSLEVLEGLGHFAGFMSAPRVLDRIVEVWDQRGAESAEDQVTRSADEEVEDDHGEGRVHHGAGRRPTDAFGSPEGG